jgi:hypothetical protein
VLARAVQPHLAQALGQPVLVDNRSGAGGNVAGAEVVHNGNDGHTFLLVPSTLESVNPSMFSKMPFDPQRDLRPAAQLANSQLFLFVRASLGVDTLEAFIAHAKKNPDKLSYGSAGNGTTPHLAAELLKQASGITAAHALPGRCARDAGSDGGPDRLRLWPCNPVSHGSGGQAEGARGGQPPARGRGARDPHFRRSRHRRRVCR